MTYEKELEEYLSENTNGWDTQRAHMLNEWEGEGLELDGHKLEYVEHTGLRGGGDNEGEQHGVDHTKRRVDEACNVVVGLARGGGNEALHQLQSGDRG